MGKLTKTQKKSRLMRLKPLLHLISIVFFFFFFTIISVFALYELQFKGKIYPGITVEGIALTAKTGGEVQAIFDAKNTAFTHVAFVLIYEDKTATISAAEINLGYNTQLIADQAFTIGRTGNVFADIFNKARAWFGDLTLASSYSLDRQALEKILAPLIKEVTIQPVDAVFEVKGNRVLAFRPSQYGQVVDMSQFEDSILTHMPDIIAGNTSSFELTLPVKRVRPSITLEDTNRLGIREYLGSGISTFRGSITNRIHNIALATSRIDGTIVPAGGVFSFNDTVGDVSKLTGYKEAYIIKDGKTILGDGGGVCQVSTTLFRAMLNTGLPIIERHPHSYRVSYYELDSLPGLDATVYAPSYDLKFKNDTGAAILIEAYTDPSNSTLTFDFYGSYDGRQVNLTKPTVTNQIPAPPNLYQDDPTLPVGVVKQVDFKAPGATVTFSRTVQKDGNVLAAESLSSSYRPWQAVFLRGTKEN